MKVLIITYYWPPAGGSGVQRWLKFVKYLQDFGVEPIVYTVKNVNYPNEDKTLLNDIPKGVKVIKQTIWDPTTLPFLINKRNTNKGISNLSRGRILSFVRGNFFIPDPKVFWVKKSVKYLQKFLEKKRVDAIISTGPPHSMHLIAKKLHQKNKVKWIADFRDPWTDLYYTKDFSQLQFAKTRNKKLEVSVLESADCILTVSNTLKNEYANVAKKTVVITNGFDDEYKGLSKIKLDNYFSISYIGLLPKQSNSKMLFKVLQELCLENNDFKNDLRLNFVGDISSEVKESVQVFNLEENTVFKDYVPHKQAIEIQKKSQVLLVLIPYVEKSEGILTGKLFEYLTAKRPILAIGPKNGDLSKILENTQAGVVVDFNDAINLKSQIVSLYKKYQKKVLDVKSKNIEQYHRKNLTKDLVDLLKNFES